MEAISRPGLHSQHITQGTELWFWVFLPRSVDENKDRWMEKKDSRQTSSSMWSRDTRFQQVRILLHLEELLDKGNKRLNKHERETGKDLKRTKMTPPFLVRTLLRQINCISERSEPLIVSLLCLATAHLDRMCPLISENLKSEKLTAAASFFFFFWYTLLILWINSELEQRAVGCLLTSAWGAVRG